MCNPITEIINLTAMAIEIRHLTNFMSGNTLKTVDGTIDSVNNSHIGFI